MTVHPHDAGPTSSGANATDRPHDATAGARQVGRAPGAEPPAAEQVLIALADPIRRRILGTLAAEGPGTATRLAADLPVSRQAVMKHLVMLDRAGLVSVRRHGREMRYRIHPQPLDETAAWLAGLAARWEQRLTDIKSIAEAAARADPG
jgi:DNA-binding transcriptional ArsR family regulator